MWEPRRDMGVWVVQNSQTLAVLRRKASGRTMNPSVRSWRSKAAAQKAADRANNPIERK